MDEITSVDCNTGSLGQQSTDIYGNLIWLVSTGVDNILAGQQLDITCAVVYSTAERPEMQRVSLNAINHCLEIATTTTTTTTTTTPHPVDHAQSLLELTDGKIDNLLDIQNELDPGSALSNSINDLLSMLQDLSGGLGNIHSSACCGFAFSSPFLVDQSGQYSTDISIYACSNITNGVSIELR